MDDNTQDTYELHLVDMTKLLKQCQDEKNSSSCLNCEALFSCDTRKNYVEAVYGSMSKGEVGEFDFN